MKKHEIVKEKKDFDNIIKTGHYYKSKSFTIYNKENKLTNSRFGIAVGKKIGHAVIRNKLKRQMRMIITNNKFLFPNNQDYIIIMKRSALNQSYKDIEEEIKNIMQP